MWMQTGWRSQIFLGGSLEPWAFICPLSFMTYSDGEDRYGDKWFNRRQVPGVDWDCAVCPGLASPGSSSRRELTFLGTTLKRPRAQVKQSWFCQDRASHISSWWKSALPRKMERDFVKYLVLSLVCTQWVFSLPFFVNWPAADSCCCLMFNEMCPSGDSQAWY